MYDKYDDDVSIYVVAGKVCACQAFMPRLDHVIGVVPRHADLWHIDSTSMSIDHSKLAPLSEDTRSVEVRYGE